MPSRQLIPVITLIAFAWLSAVALREHRALKSARNRLSQAAQILEGSGPEPGERRMRLLSEAFGFERLHYSGARSEVTAALPASPFALEKLLRRLGVVREMELEAELRGPYPGWLRALWIDRSLFGHLGWLLAFSLLGWWWRLLRGRQAEAALKAEGRIGLERDGRLRAESELLQLKSFERLLASVTQRLATLAPQELEEGIREVLKELGTALKADRCAAFLVPPGARTMDYAWGWQAQGLRDGAMEPISHLPTDSFPWLLRRLKEGELIYSGHVADLPDEARNEKYILTVNQALSLMAAPMRSGAELIGFLAVVTVRDRRSWDEEAATLLRLAGLLLAGAVSRSRSHVELGAMLEKERILGLFSHAFLRLEGDALAAGVEDGLKSLATFLRCDRASILQTHSDGSLLSVSHEWCAPGMPAMKPSSQDMAYHGLPALRARMEKGESWAVADLAGLGHEEESEGAEWKRRQAHSFLAWPLWYHGICMGVLLLERRDPGGFSRRDEDAASRASELLANLLARNRSENALRRSEAHSRTLLRSVPDLLIRMDKDGRILDLRQPEGSSEAPAPVVGQPLESLEGRISSFNPAGLAARLREAMALNRPLSLDWEAQTGRGRRWQEVRLNPNDSGFLLMLRDIQDEKLRELDHEKLLANLIAIFNSGSQAIIMVSRQGLVEAFNQNAHLSAHLLFGKGRELQAGIDFQSQLPAQSRAAYDQAFVRALHGEEIRRERELPGPEGLPLWFREEFLPVFREDSSVRSVLISYESLAALKSAEQALRESEERYALAARGSNDGLWDWNLVTGRMFFSARFCSMLGLDETRAPRDLKEWLSLIHPDDRELFRSRLEVHLMGQTSQFECEHRVFHSGTGDYAWMLVRGLAVFPPPGAGPKAQGSEGLRASRVAGSQTDVDLRKRQESRLAASSLSDPLTGLPNRALVLDRLGRSLARLKRQKKARFALVLMDTDNFKMINESLGHELGNELLISVARRLEGLLRPGDTVGRLGGDEFALLVEDLHSARDVLNIAERIHEEMRPAFKVAGKEVYLSLSLGIAHSEGHYAQPEEVLRDAEMAMYQAKARGPSHHIIFDQAMHAQAVSRLEMETDLRRAVASRAFHLHYQPIVRLKDGSLYGYEALLRWNHPTKGMIAPSDFIPLAEETRQILPLGRYVIEEGCRRLGLLAAQGRQDLIMNINLSALQLENQRLADELREAMLKEGIGPGRLQLEITESVLMENPTAAAAAFESFKALGLKLAVDDFGTGYSSLSHLHRFPLDTLKIDRSFVARMDGLAENEAIIAAVTNLGRDLKLAVVAEGVENELQKERLVALGCELAQGYFFGKPAALEP